MSKVNVEEVKDKSRSLRGALKDTISSGETHFSDEDLQLLKFHGSYQQDDRDLRTERRKAGLDKAWSFMIRSKIPGGELSSEQYIVHDIAAEDLANGTIRLTTRQGIQFHGILIGDMDGVIQQIVDCGLTTWGACGDVVRNTMACTLPLDTPAHREALELSRKITEVYLPHSTAYSEIWLNGERLEIEKEDADEPIYGKHYLPRKFKIGIAVPPVNDIDIYSQDVGIVPHESNSEVTHYTFLVGGGFGMAHGKKETYPCLAKPLCTVEKDQVMETLEAIVTTQRDFGNREDRKQARMKYLIEKKGLDWFRREVASRVNFAVQDPRALDLDSVSDVFGWNEQGDGKWFLTVYVPQGRIKDTESVTMRKAFREICEELNPTVRITPNTNLMFCNVDASDKEKIDAILTKHNVADATQMTVAHRMSHACVSLPTCGLGLAESERVFTGVMNEVDDILRDLSLEKEPILFRMSGCPNGCPRPYNADFSFVGRAPRKYAFYVGGSYRGDRLVGLQEKVITQDEIPLKVRPILEDYVENRQEGETFSDYWGRTQSNGAAPHPDQFHVELAERNSK
ncbi:MAG: NADPH-dependent assimilatory sulfite reductase hemoprotein subunit [Verrucomicrobiota bacterium]